MGLTKFGYTAAILALCLAKTAIGQVPMGDTPCAAPVVSPAGYCAPNGTNNQYVSDLTYTDYLGGAACNGAEKPVDGWIAFTANANQTSIFWTEQIASNSVLYLYEEVAAGTCPTIQPTLNQVACVNDNPPGVGQQEHILFNTTIGTTYYLRVKRIVDVFDNSQSGYLCIVGCQLSVIPQVAQNASCKDSCDGVTVVTPTGGLAPITYAWDGNTGNQTDSMATGLCDGVYNVQLTDSAGCALNIGLTVTEPALFQTSLGSVGTTCNNSSDGSVSASTSGGTTPYTYLWSDGTTTSNATGLTAGVYTISISDNGTCFVEDSITVTEPDSITFQANTTDVSCLGDTNGVLSITNIIGGSGNYDFKLDTGNTFVANSVFQPLAVGTYSIVVRDDNGCKDSTSVTIGQPTALGVFVVPVDATCAESCDGSIAAFPSGGTMPYTYTWTNGYTGQDQLNLCPDTFRVTVSDANGCTADTIGVVDGPDSLHVNLISTNVNCHGGSDGTGTATVTGGIAPYSYAWSGTFQTDSTITGMSAGTYSVTVTDDHGCTITDTLAIIQPGALAVNPGAIPDTLCIGAISSISAQAVGGNGPPYNYFWNTGNTTSSFLDTLEASISYSVYATDWKGCQSSFASASVFVYPELEVHAVLSETVICEGTTTTLFANGTGGTGGPYTFNAVGESFTGQDFTHVFNPNNYPDPVTYTVNISDGCSPPASTTVSVSYHTSPTIQMATDTTGGCQPVTVFISHTSTPVLADVFWDFGDGTSLATNQNQVVHTYPDEGDYYISLTVVHSGNSCVKTGTLAYPITVDPLPNANFVARPQPTTVMDPDIQFTDLSEGNIYFWQWAFYHPDTTLMRSSFLPSPTVTYPDVPGTYPVSLVVKTLANCIDTTWKTVRIDDDFAFWAPTAFTPNNDGRNDEFYPEGIGWNPDRYTFLVFTRQGERIFETNTVGEAWDGLRRDNGEPAATGVYVWKVIVENQSASNDNEQVFIGNVTLVR